MRGGCGGHPSEATTEQADGRGELVCLAGERSASSAAEGRAGLRFPRAMRFLLPTRGRGVDVVAVAWTWSHRLYRSLAAICVAE